MGKIIGVEYVIIILVFFIAVAACSSESDKFRDAESEQKTAQIEKNNVQTNNSIQKESSLQKDSTVPGNKSLQEDSSTKKDSGVQNKSDLKKADNSPQKQGNSPQPNVIPIDSDQADILNAKNVVNVNDKYLVVICDNEQSVFKVFSIPGFNYLYSWGKKGRGPGELTIIGYSSSVNTEGNNLFFYDANLLRHNKYTVTDTALVFNDTFTFSPGEGGQGLSDILRFGDSLYVASNSGFFSGKEFIAVAPDQKEALFKFSDYPQTELEATRRFFEYSKQLAAQPGGSKFIAFYTNQDAFKILNKKGETLQYSKINDSHIEAGKRTRRLDIEATNDNIYVLSSIATQEEFDDEQFHDYDYVIEVWNWDGEQIRRFDVDDALRRISVDQTHEKIYGFSLSQADRVYVFDMDVAAEYRENIQN